MMNFSFEHMPNHSSLKNGSVDSCDRQPDQTSEKTLSGEEGNRPFNPTIIQAHIQAIRDLVAIIEPSGLNQIDYQYDHLAIKLYKNSPETPGKNSGYNGLPMTAYPGIFPQGAMLAPPAPMAHLPHGNSSENTMSTGHQSEMSVPQGTSVKSPLVGTAYMAPNPEANPFVQEGDQIQEGQTLMIIEAMKVMNPIKASCSGRIRRICVKNGDPVEYDQVLLWME